MLPPANLVEISDQIESVEHNSWWDYDFSKTDNSMSFSQAKNETKKLFEQAVKRQLISDVPVGSYLSGVNRFRLYRFHCI